LLDIIELKNNLKGKFIENSPLKNHNWFKVGGMADYLFIPENLEDLIYFLKNKPKSLQITIIGAGSNILVKDSGVKGCVIKLSNFNSIKKISETKLEVQSGVLNISLANFAKEEEIGGFEFISGIPGSIGGGIAMNAGCYGREFKDILLNVSAVDFDGNLHSFENIQCGFSYRNCSLSKNLIFITAIFNGYKDIKSNIQEKLDNIKTQREEQQPKKVLTGGSTFANPEGNKAWQLIDSVGLRGYKIGGAFFSEKHCNFIINDGTATALDIQSLINEAIKRVKDKHNIILHPEIKIIGKDN
jgi:UDP-N-acetylmuramate dehydrogenase